MGICEKHERQARNYQDVGVEFCDTNVEQQVALANEKTTAEINNQLHLSVKTNQPVDNATAYKLDQPHTQSDCNTKNVESGMCGVKSCEAEDTNVVHVTHDVKTEQIGEQDTNDLDTNQHDMSVESKLPLDNAIQEKHKVDEYVTNIKFVESNDPCVEVGDMNNDTQKE